MSQPNSAADGISAQKQRFNVYTMMLILSFFALVIGSVLLYLELTEYGDYPWWVTSGAERVSRLELPRLPLSLFSRGTVL